MPCPLSVRVFRVNIGCVLASKVFFCSKHRAEPWKIKKQTGIWRGNNFFLNRRALWLSPIISDLLLGLFLFQGNRQRWITHIT